MFLAPVNMIKLVKPRVSSVITAAITVGTTVTITTAKRTIETNATIVKRTSQSNLKKVGS